MNKVELYLIPNSNWFYVSSYGVEALKINYMDLYKKFIALGYEEGKYKEMELFSKEDNVLILEYYQPSLGTYFNSLSSVAEIAKRIKKYNIDNCEIVMLEVEAEDYLGFEGLVFSNLDKARDDLKVTKRLINLKGDI